MEDTPRWLACPGFKEADVACTHEQRVWPEDEDASLGELYGHIRSVHADGNDRLAEKLLSRVVEVTHP